MKLQPDKSNAPVINAYDRAWIEVNGIRHGQSLSVTSLPEIQPAAWGSSEFETLEQCHFKPWAQMGVELVLFGSGQKLRFAQAIWLQDLISQGIGVETMDTAAACRTYNILASEGRKVVALLLIES
ncbi:Mth938-like domain-containing protein [Limnohabitans sp.]|uniref:Mth938-like domain-containing protein n=1 Tax=Limnohabitans sp. TaxID=1907725 RepID=UPI0039BC9435|nr:MTH938/NDUFAF3 family protein [Comamonadaceae bacterium]